MKKRRTKPSRRAALGSQGERIAERLLRRAGLIVLARNWRGGGGELDRVLLEGDTLVFVEVKTRTAGFDGSPGSREYGPVSYAQRLRNRRAAQAFRRRYGVPDLRVRFDLITVTGSRAEWEKDYYRAP